MPGPGRVGAADQHHPALFGAGDREQLEPASTVQLPRIDDGDGRAIIRITIRQVPALMTQVQLSRYYVSRHPSESCHALPHAP